MKIALIQGEKGVVDWMFQEAIRLGAKQDHLHPDSSDASWNTVDTLCSSIKLVVCKYDWCIISVDEITNIFGLDYQVAQAMGNIFASTLKEVTTSIKRYNGAHRSGNRRGFTGGDKTLSHPLYWSKCFVNLSNAITDSDNEHHTVLSTPSGHDGISQGVLMIRLLSMIVRERRWTESWEFSAGVLVRCWTGPESDNNATLLISERELCECAKERPGSLYFLAAAPKANADGESNVARWMRKESKRKMNELIQVIILPITI